MTPGSSTEFTVSLDLVAKITSALVAVILLVVVLATHLMLIACLGLLLLGLTYGYSARRYVISGPNIVVRRIIRDAVVPLEDVREVRPAVKDDFRGCIRLWGNGGLFGYYGLFRTSKLGNCTWYVTNRKNSVIVATAKKTALFSPDDVQGFVATIRSSVPVLDRPAGERSPDTPQPFSVWRSLPVWIGLALGALALIIAGLAVLDSPGPPAYDLTRDTLTIHDRFYPVTLHAAGVDVNSVRVIDLNVDREWRPVLRTNGFANAHYASGWYRVAGGQTVRMYKADARRMVLLPPKGGGTPVLLEVRDPDGFVAKVRSQWG
jgi:hypothetical protein